MQLAAPIAEMTACWLAGVLTSSVTTSVVISDSTTPTRQRMHACLTICSAAPGRRSTARSYLASRKKGMGKRDSSERRATSPIVSVRRPCARMRSSRADAMTMARSDEGNILAHARGIFGTNSMVSMLTVMIASMRPSSTPPFHVARPASSCALNGWSCARKITMARPLQKPTMTGSPIIVTNRAPPPSQTRPISTPASITDGKRSSTPSPLSPRAFGLDRKVAMTAANAPDAPWIMPGRPPKSAHTSPTIHALCSATAGRTCARKAKDTDSGTCANEMTTPRSTSVLTYASRSARDICDHAGNGSPSLRAVGARGADVGEVCTSAIIVSWLSAW
mmetsp:Transcript_12684/g.39915  ORF Transcript_12684/g.39915 Transcript_12684/m.39915 type:complete len:335 (+) Transcript_12684:809-1813(+)